MQQVEVISIEFLQHYRFEQLVEATRQCLIVEGHQAVSKDLHDDFHPAVARVLLKRATEKFAKQGT